MPAIVTLTKTFTAEDFGLSGDLIHVTFNVTCSGDFISSFPADNYSGLLSWKVDVSSEDAVVYAVSESNPNGILYNYLIPNYNANHESWNNIESNPIGYGSLDPEDPYLGFGFYIPSLKSGESFTVHQTFLDVYTDIYGEDPIECRFDFRAIQLERTDSTVEVPAVEFENGFSGLRQFDGIGNFRYGAESAPSFWTLPSTPTDNVDLKFDPFSGSSSFIRVGKLYAPVCSSNEIAVALDVVDEDYFAVESLSIDIEFVHDNTFTQYSSDSFSFYTNLTAQGPLGPTLGTKPPEGFPENDFMTVAVPATVETSVDLSGPSDFSSFPDGEPFTLRFNNIENEGSPITFTYTPNVPMLGYTNTTNIATYTPRISLLNDELNYSNNKYARVKLSNLNYNVYKVSFSYHEASHTFNLVPTERGLEGWIVGHIPIG